MLKIILGRIKIYESSELSAQELVILR